VRIFADENVPTLLVEGLRRAGHDVRWGCEYDQGATDPQRIAEAQAERRVILTEDNDFAEHLIRDGLAIEGLIRFDLPGLGRDRKAIRILEAMAEIGDDASGKAFVIEHARIRMRLIT
jgi:hypothetical protein